MSRNGHRVVLYWPLGVLAYLLHRLGGLNVLRTNWLAVVILGLDRDAVMKWQIFSPFGLHDYRILGTCRWCHEIVLRKLQLWNHYSRDIGFRVVPRWLLMVLLVVGFCFDAGWLWDILVWLKWTQISSDEAIAAIITQLLASPYIFIKLLFEGSLSPCVVISVSIIVLALLHL